MPDIFILINPKSGAKMGDQICNLGVRQISFSSQENIPPVNLHFYNLMEPEDFTKACSEILKIQSRSEIIRVIVAGGDGSILLVIENFIKNEIKLENCLFGILPFGTGNHLSWNFGWGNYIKPMVAKIGFPDIKERIEEWMKADIVNLDLWDVVWECNEDGGFKKIFHVKDEGTSVRYMKERTPEGTEKNKLVYSGKMTNYLSFGYDAEVGFAFEKERKRTRVKNIFTYFVNGCKMAMKKVPRVTDIIENIEKLKYVDDPEDPQKKILSPEYMIFLRKRVISLQALRYLNKDLYRDLKNVSVILFLNIPSYAGHKNVWTYKDAVGGVNDQKNGLFGPIDPQKIDDGMLEMIAFDSPFSLVRGKADRILQTEGPIEIKFFKAQPNEPPISTYFEINGEHMEVISPKRLIISKSTNPGKLKCLKRVETQEKK